MTEDQVKQHARMLSAAAACTNIPEAERREYAVRAAFAWSYVRKAVANGAQVQR